MSKRGIGFLFVEQLFELIYLSLRDKAYLNNFF